MESDDLRNIVSNLTDHTTDPSRPFTGQPHTVQGTRGKTKIEGITFRDLADCVAKAFVDSSACLLKDEKFADELRLRAEDGTLNYNDLFLLPDAGMDPVALIQNISVRVEKTMGIFPNVPKLED